MNHPTIKSVRSKSFYSATVNCIYMYAWVVEWCPGSRISTASTLTRQAIPESITDRMFARLAQEAISLHTSRFRRRRAK